MNRELLRIIGEVFLFAFFVTSWAQVRRLRRRLVRTERWRAAYSAAVEKFSFLIEQSPDEHLRIAADRITDEMVERGCERQ